MDPLVIVRGAQFGNHGRKEYSCILTVQYFIYYVGGTRWCSWLRHCATNRKVAGSIPNGVTEIFH
jgi:hypothetical protein